MLGLAMVLAESMVIVNTSVATQSPEPAPNTSRASSLTAELQPAGPATSPQEDAAPSAKSSLNWMTQSLQRVARKLESISEKIDPSATQEQIELKVKEAFQEAFSEIASEEQDAESSASDGTPRKTPSPPTPPSKNRSTKRRNAEGIIIHGGGSTVKEGIMKEGTVIVGEVNANSEILDLELDRLPVVEMNASTYSPYLSESAPPWVRGSMVTEDVVRLPISSSFFTTVEECREDLQARLVSLVHQAIVEDVLHSDSSVELAPLTKEYIETHLLHGDIEFDNATDRPSGTYHQLFRLIQIQPEQLREIRGWERSEITRKRAEQLGIGSAIAMGLITSLSGCVRLLARREQRLRAKRATT